MDVSAAIRLATVVLEHAPVIAAALRRALDRGEFEGSVAEELRQALPEMGESERVEKELRS